MAAQAIIFNKMIAYLCKEPDCFRLYGICSKMMQILYGDMQAVRSGGDLTLVGGTEANVKDYVCPDGCVCFRMTAEKTGAENFYKGF